MKVVVIGAGATGLAVGYLLARAGVSVTIVEAAPRPGGLLATFDVGDGHRLEHFYHHFFIHDAEINWLLDQLGLTDRVIFRKTTMGIFRSGRLYPFNGPRDLLRFDAIGLAARFRFGLSSAMLAWLKGYSEKEQLSCLKWFRRWAGREATGAVWQPLLKIKFGGVIEHTHFVPPQAYGGRHLVYLSRYLTADHPLWPLDDRSLLELQLGQLERIYGRDVGADMERHWIFRARFAATLTDLGFHRRIPRYQSPIENLYVASTCHVYPDERSVNNSIRVAAELLAAMGMAEPARIVPRGISLAAKYGH